MNIFLSERSGTVRCWLARMAVGLAALVCMFANDALAQAEWRPPSVTPMATVRLAQPPGALPTTAPSNPPSATPAPSPIPSRPAGLSPSVSGPGPGCEPPAAPNEIVELARALKWNPDLIYEYVHNNIVTIPIYDSLKGPLGTLIDQAGTPVDQAELMFTLLQQSCFSPQYEVGMIFLTPVRLDEWLGTFASIPNNPGQSISVSAILASNGFCTGFSGSPPACTGARVYTDQNNQVTGADVPWIWISVPIGGTTYQFDPASKIFPNNSGDGYLPRSRGLGANFATALGYSQSGFLTDAESGATGIGTPALGFSTTGRTNLRNDLNQYTSNLIAYIKGNNPTASTTDIVGGGTIALLPTYTPPSGSTEWGQTSLPYPNQQGIPPTSTSSLQF